MKKNKNFILFIGILFLFTGKGKEPLFEVVSIKYPKEIVVPKGWKGEELKCEIEICYRYKGEDIKGSGCIFLRPTSAVYYLNEKGKILPEAFEYWKQRYLFGGMCWGGVDGEEILQKGQLFEEKVDLLSKNLFANTEVDETIQKKELPKIIVRIKELRIHLDVDGVKRECKIKINKKIKIKVKYEK